MKSFTKYGLLFYVLLACAFATPASGQQIKIVANPVGPPDALSFNELQTVFKAQRQWWENDTKISIALLKSFVPVSEAIADKVFGMTQNEVKTYWIQIVFRGKAATPKHFASEAAVISYLEATPGAIGVVSAEIDVGDLKTIAIEGKEAW